MENFKKKIESRYIPKKGKQKDLKPDEIREIFLPFIDNPEEFLSLSDREILIFYTEWYAMAKDSLNISSEEVIKPDL